MEKNYEIVDSLEKLSARLEKIKKAQKSHQQQSLAPTSR